MSKQDFNLKEKADTVTVCIYNSKNVKLCKYYKNYNHEKFDSCPIHFVFAQVQLKHMKFLSWNTPSSTCALLKYLLTTLSEGELLLLRQKMKQRQ